MHNGVPAVELINFFPRPRRHVAGTNGAVETECMKFPTIPRIVAVLVGALLLTWPAIYNRYPLLYPDSMSYLEDGRLVARALFLHKVSADYGGRSFIYCLGILPFHGNRNPWPIVGLNALLTAWVIWLVVRSIRPKHIAASFLVLIIALAAITSLAWFVSLIMPDILGPLAYLSIYLLLFASETFSAGERLGLWVLAWWGVASHATHLILAAGLCCVVAIVMALQGAPRRSWLPAAGRLAALIALVAAAHLAIHTYLYGKPSLNGKRPPFLMARVIVDGPGRWYLQRHCGEVQFTICTYLPAIHEGITDDEFLWEAHGIWKSASPITQEQLRAEESRFVIATIRTYPHEELHAALGNFKEQLTTFGLWDYGPNPWVLEVFDEALPGKRDRYLQSRQAVTDLPQDFSSTAQTWAVMASIVLLCLIAAIRWRHLSRRLLALAAIIVSITVANALVTGVLSNVEDRYQSRVIWLLPFLAGMFVLDWIASQNKDSSCPLMP